MTLFMEYKQLLLVLIIRVRVFALVRVLSIIVASSHPVLVCFIIIIISFSFLIMLQYLFSFIIIIIFLHMVPHPCDENVMGVMTTKIGYFLRHWHAPLSDRRAMFFIVHRKAMVSMTLNRVGSVGWVMKFNHAAQDARAVGPYTYNGGPRNISYNLVFFIEFRVRPIVVILQTC